MSPPMGAHRGHEHLGPGESESGEYPGVVGRGNTPRPQYKPNRTELVWSPAITLASAAVAGTPAEQRWGGMRMRREGRIGHLPGSREQKDLPTEGALGGAATHALVGCLSCVDAKPRVDRDPIRAMAAEEAKCKRADARAKARAAREGAPPPQSLDVTGDGVTPLTPVAGEVTAGESAAARPEDPAP